MNTTDTINALRDALTALCELKKHKDIYGKDSYYFANRNKVWGKAEQVLALPVGKVATDRYVASMEGVALAMVNATRARAELSPLTVIYELPQRDAEIYLVEAKAAIEACGLEGE